MEKLFCERLLDENQPISERFRALFYLCNLKGSLPRNALIQATRDSSNLLAHEAAFFLGQMQDVEAIPALENVLMICHCILLYAMRLLKLLVLLEFTIFCFKYLLVKLLNKLASVRALGLGGGGQGLTDLQDGSEEPPVAVELRIYKD
ncbi:hypothetical protein POM88_002687 [Heracleum sosnowskyi]|uniref:Uncharacterized protein n=1 Tax=Heracleum sosnowskyi TaxID=360622 RepID=A0AAD8NBJ0_9APIA|nr:hypothetical protein POM88_002687 [Heracleum sosnowskyi]